MKNIKQKLIKTSILLTGALFFWAHPVTGHENAPLPHVLDTVRVIRDTSLSVNELKDTVLIEKGDVVKEFDQEELTGFMQKHSPHKATIYSAVLPGLGQIYNRKYWKVPIIYLIGYGFYSGFGLDWGWKYYNDIYTEYRQIYQDEYYKGNTGDETLIENSQRIMTEARERRDKIVIWMGILYFANVVDAMADAYFFYYDISDDLSMQVVPSVSTTDQYVAHNDYSYGFTLSLKF